MRPHQVPRNTPTKVLLYKHNARIQEVASPPKSLATSYITPHLAAPHLVKPLRHAATFSGNNKKVRTTDQPITKSAQVSVYSTPSLKTSQTSSISTSSNSNSQNKVEAAEAMDIGLFKNQYNISILFFFSSRNCYNAST